MQKMGVESSRIPTLHACQERPGYSARITFPPFFPFFFHFIDFLRMCVCVCVCVCVCLFVCCVEFHIETLDC